VEESTLAIARTLVAQKFKERGDFLAALEKVLGAQLFSKLKSTLSKGDHIPWYATQADGPIWGFSARGWLGQYLVVIPAAGLVAVRMRAPEKSDYSSEGEEKDGYRTFANDVRALVGAAPAGR
jgi:CubicO group peptidase (beta-lactamase class C family)